MPPPRHLGGLVFVVVAVSPLCRQGGSHVAGTTPYSQKKHGCCFQAVLWIAIGGSGQSNRFLAQPTTVAQVNWLIQAQLWLIQAIYCHNVDKS